MKAGAVDGDRSPSGYALRLDAGQRARLEHALSPEQRRVLLDHGTEAPFCSSLLDERRVGIFACALCALPLFRSRGKCASASGWPSFFEPFDAIHLQALEDRSHGMRRVEVRCARCGGHLGHRFDDGPPPEGIRYCINGAALRFIPEEVAARG